MHNPVLRFRLGWVGLGLIGFYGILAIVGYLLYNTPTAAQQRGKTPQRTSCI